MNKKLLAVAVAGTFLAPAAALAQSSVTISGKLIASFGGYTLGGRAAGAAGRGTETITRDESSRIIFSVREDLTPGLAPNQSRLRGESDAAGGLWAFGDEHRGQIEKV